MKVDLKYLAIGGNRNSSATDYSPSSGILAFGAGHGVALWKPLAHDNPGVYAILRGHTGDVNAVRFISDDAHQSRFLLTGAADKQIRVWRQDSSSDDSFQCMAVLDAHAASINCIASLPDSSSFVSGSADGTIKLWSIDIGSETFSVELDHQVVLQPRYFPLALAWHSLSSGASVLVVGGTRSTVQVYRIEGGHQSNCSLVATLTGHEGWIRSLDITTETSEPESDILIASASQDKYIRIWRIHQGENLPSLASQDDGSRLGSVERSLSSKAQRFEVSGLRYTLSFEALLLGHEDWVYTALWDKQSKKLRLLSASADSSLSLWEPDPASGVWFCNTRLGEISAQKGSTTATGSAGGFFSGLWFDGGRSVACLGRTGSWRVWNQPNGDGPWTPALGVTGHIREVRDVAWAKDGSYLLSTSSDQTTRVHAPWKRGTKRTWHEFARPQIHGYDLNCVDSIDSIQIISGADEKLLRVFDEPSGSSVLLQNLAGAERSIAIDSLDAASMPVLGLSNKAVEISNEIDEEMGGDMERRELVAPTVPTQASDHPPFEDDLSRHTLWPEKEKLYGHGYEISAVASSHDGKIVATACKASSIDHAVVRLYETSTWREMSPVLKAHSLTVTCLRFSDDDQFLLSVGRDRQWAVFARDSADALVYSPYIADPKGHARMILGAAWAPQTPTTQAVFATAGRDKNIKIWALDAEKSCSCKMVIQAAAPVLTVDFLPTVKDGSLLLASGTETGTITFSTIGIDRWEVISSFDLQQNLSPLAAITQVSWKRSDENLLAIASEDHSLQVVSISAWPSG